MAGYIGSKAVSVNTTSATISDDLSVDGVTFNVDSSNNRIGIGTTAPSDIVEIDVAGSNTGLTLTDNGDGFFPQIKLDANRSGAGQGLGKFSWHWNGTEVARIEGAAGVDATNKDDGSLLFNTRASGASMATQMTILHDGTVSVARGNLVIGTAGKGIDFSAQTATSATAASATAELLDHYEEGTWTPVVAGQGGGARTMGSTNKGYYTRIGRQVTVTGTIHVTGSETLTDNVVINGLPFDADPSSNYRAVASAGANTLFDTGSAGERLAIAIDPNNSFMFVVSVNDNTPNYAHLANAAVGTGNVYGVTMTYDTDA